MDHFPECDLASLGRELERLKLARDDLDALIKEVEESLVAKRKEERADLPYDAFGDYSTFER